FTIRAWSRRTLRETACQSMACQPVARSGAAPAGVAAADICLSPLAGWPGSLVTKDQREVGALSGGVLSPWAQPLSASLPGGLRFLPPPLPAAPPVGLAASSPHVREATGLPRSVAVAAWVRSCLSAGGATSAYGEFGAP